MEGALALAEDVVQSDASGSPDNVEPVWMDPEDSKALAEHYEHWFGAPNQILYHERRSEGVHLDTLIYPPTDDRPFITAATQQE